MLEQISFLMISSTGDTLPKRIRGALKDAINNHGPIKDTPESLESACKRLVAVIRRYNYDVRMDKANKPLHSKARNKMFEVIIIDGHSRKSNVMIKTRKELNVILSQIECVCSYGADLDGKIWNRYDYYDDGDRTCSVFAREILTEDIA